MANPQDGTASVRFAAAFDREVSLSSSVRAESLGEKTPAYLQHITWQPGHEKALQDALAGRSLCGFDEERLRTQGFAVKQHTDLSFGRAFLNLYQSDARILITVDAILYAWHRSFDKILMAVEERFCLPTVKRMLDGALASLVEMEGTLADGHWMRSSLPDARTFLEVSLALSEGAAMGQQAPDPTDPRWSRGRFGIGSLPADEPATPQEAVTGDQWSESVKRILSQIKSQSGSAKLKMFGEDIAFDFSHFKPRGHYTKTPGLSRYFAVMMWLGRVQLPIRSEQALGGVLTLVESLKRAEVLTAVENLDSVLQAFVGESDSATVGQLHAAVTAVCGDHLPSEGTASFVTEVRKILMTAGIGKQEYGTGGQVSQFAESDPRQDQLDAVFCFMGQRFSLDAWAMSKVLHENILVDGKKVNRRVASSIDVAYSVFSNDAAAEILRERMLQTGSARNQVNQYRDGLEFTPNLEAVRQVMDKLPEEEWMKSIAASWLGALRALSETDERRPEAMRTRAWARKTLNAQAASYANLRHDTILYIKPAGAGVCGCDTPHAYVEPQVAFWRALQRLCEVTAANLARLRGGGVEHAFERPNLAAFLGRFRDVVTALLQISEKELTHECLNLSESTWLRQAIESRMGASGIGSMSGWYYDLFYNESALKSEVMVADIMTDYPDPLGSGSEGGVLHCGVRDADLLCLVVERAGRAASTGLPGAAVPYTTRRREVEMRGDLAFTNQCAGFCPGKDSEDWQPVGIPTHESNGEQVPVDQSPAFFVGPVFSFYEFLTPFGQRLSDEDWEKRSPPPRPEWTNEFLGPAQAAPPGQVAPQRRRRR
mmetsp:Transcript_109853/g.218176  ORF Transcript_109853/g.218176 Transcript_109853/m.218176 type:complete len:828 (-) Transcript_109853:137-2620(-)